MPTMQLPTDYVVSSPEKTPFERQAVEAPGTKKPGQTGHYRNAVWGFRDVNSPNTFTAMDQLFEAGLSHGRDRPFLGIRPKISDSPLKFANHYVWQSWGEVDIARRRVGSALEALFASGVLKPASGDLHTVGIWSPNRPEWQITDIASRSYKKVVVCLYDTLGNDSAEYIINHSELGIVLTTAEHVSTLLKIAPKVPGLKVIVSFDELEPEPHRILSEWAKTVDIALKTWKEFQEDGEKVLIEPTFATPEQVASIAYTSGTTGPPKGVVISHKAMATAITNNLFGMGGVLPESPTVISYLPLAHIYGRVIELVLTVLGGRIGYWTGDPLRLIEDTQVLRPHEFASVPRLLNRVYQSAMVAGNAPGIKGALFRKALAVKLDRLEKTGEVNHPFWDRLVFNKIKAVLGGNVLEVTTGSAPISLEVLNFLKVALGAPIQEGWGMTETAATGLRTWQHDPTGAGTVGPPGPFCEIKLVDVPAMNYLSEDKPYPRGELCIRGDICFSGYFKDEKNTKETIDEEGWVHTGDVAQVDSAGRVKIIDRVKNIMKLAQGEYIALEKIESTYGTIPAIAQVFVHGDSLQAFVIAVIVPDPVQLASIVTEVTGKNVSATDEDALRKACLDERVNRHYLSLCSKAARKKGLKGYEFVKRIHLSLDPFTEAENTLTPTMKLRRKDAYQKFKAELDALYAMGDQNVSKL